MNITHILEAALGQLLALGIVLTAYVVWTMARFIWSFGKAATRVRCEMVMRRRE